jgi:hypothetical protein
VHATNSQGAAHDRSTPSNRHTRARRGRRGGEHGGRAIAERDQRRAEVERLLWNLVVQREALGLAHHDGLWVTFGLPSDLQPHPHLRG